MEDLLKYCSISGTTVKEFIGEKIYIATGDIEKNKITTSSIVTFDSKPSRANQYAKKDNVIFAKMKDTVKVILIDETNEDNIYSTGFYILSCGNKLRPKYLYWYLNSESFNLQKDNLSVGATMKGLNNEGLKKIKISRIPTIVEQEKRIEKLDTIKEAIDNRVLQKKDLEKLIRNKFYELFGNINNNSKSWEKVQLSEKCRVKGGKRIPKGMDYSSIETDHPYLRATDMKEGTIIDDNIKYISDEVFEKIKKYTILAGEVYLTNVGVNLGMAGIIPERYNGANLTENAVKFVKNDKELNSTYLAYYLNTEEIQKYIDIRKMVVGVPKLAIFRIESIPLLIPPIEIQKEFENYYFYIKKIEQNLSNDIEDLNQLLNSTMNKYFNK